ncbi:APC family permease [Streptomyces sp. CB01881]|uniref:APC family permease n=1 Tax=Streptomyces sp. CB01881 TaxID=2078691 RepID=UPI000CDCAA67|nr:APC family permease [Streptomyces sp. CB01881]AUY52981.1 amino acid transporter [Streptomyces sp. CB01881]TYC70897.1 APC family permease [Streptomyces sp. CB01881]
MRKSLGLLDGAAIAASSTAATSSIGIGLGLTAGIVGLHLPAIMLLAFLPVLAIAGGYGRLNQVDPDAGSSYRWVGRTLNPWLGFLTGWVNTVGTVVFMAYTTTVTGSAIIQLLGQATVHSVLGLRLDPDSTLQCTLLGLVVLIAAALVAVRGLDLAARLQKYLLVFEYGVLLAFCGYGLFAGDQPFSLQWFNPFDIPSLGAIAQGMVLAVFCYWGFESVFSVGEEVRDPRDASRAGILALVVMMLLFLLAGTAFQRVLPLDELADNGAQGLAYFGTKLAHQPLAALPLIALTFSAVASLQAAVIPTARGLFAMGRDGVLGPVWTKLHPKHATPAVGTLLITGIACVLSLLSIAIPTVGDLISAAVNAIGIVVALYYALTAVAAAVQFRHLLRTAPLEGLRAVVGPLLGAAALLFVGGYLAWTFYDSADHFELAADNGWFELLVPVLMIASGLVAAAWARWRRRSAYFDRPAAADTATPTT